ncbi:MAG: hypothetical protein A2X86_03245 [Bdellovibrionales bacterium GWA2_49_15]|nr:MAG: hypothetical protein A2X86_03245 [Bdellovibrionales bacterium GWA2_49_15]HAZ12230.1 hypothetical protein [Bdellovibrionales bacterium]
MGRKGVYCKVILGGFGLMLMASSYANGPVLSDCGSFQNENSRRLCQQMDRIEQKVDRALQLLERGHNGGNGGGHGRYYTPTYNCKIKINATTFEGFGDTVKAAQTDVVSMCTATGYGSGTCNEHFRSCDLDAYSESGHYKCEVSINGQIFQGLGTSKLEARSMALGICKQTGYGTSTCYEHFSKCYAVPLR